MTLWSVPIVAVPVSDWFLPSDIHLAHLLVIPLALAAAFADTRRTAVTALIALAALVVAGAERCTLTTENVLVQMLSLVLFSALLLIATRLREQHQRQLAIVRQVSEAAQSVLLRPLPRRAGAVSLASTYVAAQTEARIGGDLYALLRAPGATRLIIGDARGRGSGPSGTSRPSSVPSASTRTGTPRCPISRPVWSPMCAGTWARRTAGILTNGPVNASSRRPCWRSRTTSPVPV